MIQSNITKLKDLETLGVEPHISKLLMSKNEDDFLIGWELVENHPNCEYIRAYFKGQTSIISSIEGNKYSHYYDCISNRYTFGDIIIQN